MKKLVGFIGYSQAGKDTAAQVLINRGWKRYAFADQLKRDVERCVGTPLLGPAVSAETKEFWRPLLVQYAVLRRQQHPDYWIWQLKSTLDMNEGPDSKVVITDVRYPNECAWILNRGGILIFIDRKDLKPANGEEAESIMQIWTCNELVDALSLVVNNDTIEVMQGDVLGIVEHKLGRP